MHMTPDSDRTPNFAINHPETIRSSKNEDKKTDRSPMDADYHHKYGWDCIDRRWVRGRLTPPVENSRFEFVCVYPIDSNVFHLENEDTAESHHHHHHHHR